MFDSHGSMAGKPKRSRNRRKSGSSPSSGNPETGKQPKPGKPGEPQLFETPDRSRRVRLWRCPECDWRGVAVPDGDTKWVFPHTDRKEAEAFTLAAGNVALALSWGCMPATTVKYAGRELERRA